MTNGRSADKTEMRHLVIGNPENRRVGFYQQALQKFGGQPAIVISYLDLLTNRVSLSDMLHQIDGAVSIRIESPGENFAVEKRLIALGADSSDLGNAGQVGTSGALRLKNEPGRLRLVRQWYLGFSKLLGQIKTSAAGTAGSFQNQPDDIRILFDKRKCQAILQQKMIPVPELIGALTGFDELADVMVQQNIERVFVKLSHGSSATGVIALCRLKTGYRAVTSMELVTVRGQSRVYNNLKMRTYTDPRQIAWLVDFVCREGAQIERWIPKASLGRKTFDLRVVVIKGQAKQVVVRTSRSPMTNLHLGNQRGDLEEVKLAAGSKKWNRALEVAESAAKVFPQLLYCGVDLLVQPGFVSSKVIELNAFGDLLPNVRFNGRTTYESEIA